MSYDVCIITPGHLASSPRVVKEASALHYSGLKVVVIASDHYDLMRPLDHALLRDVAWEYRLLRPADRPSTRALQKLTREVCRKLIHCGLRSTTLATHALNARHAEFCRAARSVSARLYIGHTLPGLAVAAAAASRSNGLFGFDAEDWHSEEQLPEQLAAGEKRARIHIERTLIPRCSHVTASSPLISEAYAPNLRRAPITLLNVFPLSQSPMVRTPSAQRKRAMYWFSQTAGPGRGIEEAVAALGFLPDWELHVRGQPVAGYREQLESSPAYRKVTDRVHWLPLSSPDEMVRIAGDYSVGLAVEHASPGNKARCLGNKIFTYLLGGTPVLLSDTPAHRLLATELGDAARVVIINDAAAMAAAVRALASETASEQAWQLAHSRFNWEAESVKLVAAINALLSARQSTP